MIMAVQYTCAGFVRRPYANTAYEDMAVQYTRTVTASAACCDHAPQPAAATIRRVLRQSAAACCDDMPPCAAEVTCCLPRKYPVREYTASGRGNAANATYNRSLIT
jgi:hypothetical protein